MFVPVFRFAATFWFYIVEIVLAPAFVGWDREGVEHLSTSMGWGIEKGGGGGPYPFGLG